MIKIILSYNWNSQNVQEIPEMLKIMLNVEMRVYLVVTSNKCANKI